MFRRFLCLSVGALALLVVLGAPGQLHAQRMRGGMPRGGMSGFHSGVMPGFNGGMFTPRFNGGMFTPRFNGGMFTPRFNGGMFTPSFNSGFGPGFFRPF